MHFRVSLAAVAAVAFFGCSSIDGSTNTSDPDTIGRTTEALVPDPDLPDPGPEAQRAILVDEGPGDLEAAKKGLADPKVISELRDLGSSVASTAGVQSPQSMSAVVVADHQAAETILSGATINDHRPVYVIVMTGGPFTSRRHRAGQRAPEGKVLTLSVDAGTRRITDVGYVDKEPDLRSVALGTVNLLK